MLPSACAATSKLPEFPSNVGMVKFRTGIVLRQCERLLLAPFLTTLSAERESFVKLIVCRFVATGRV